MSETIGKVYFTQAKEKIDFDKIKIKYFVVKKIKKISHVKIFQEFKKRFQDVTSVKGSRSIF